VGKALVDLAELQTHFAAMLEAVERMVAPIDLGGDEHDRAARIVEGFADPDLRDEFMKEFKTLQTAYEVLAPDPFLRDFIARYALLGQVYQVVYNYYHPEAEKRRLQRALLTKTDQLIRENVKRVGPVAGPLPLYPINRDLATVVEADEVSEQVKVINLYRSLLAHVAERREQHPYLVSIVEEVEAIIERLRQRQISVKLALEQVQAKAQEAVAAQEEQARTDMPG
jgi:type I restriction enzyme R subunit